MKYDHYLISAGRWVMGVLPDGSVERLGPDGSPVYLQSYIRHNTPPIVLPGQKVWAIGSRKIRTIVGVYCGADNAYYYRANPSLGTLDYQYSQIIPICS